MTALSHHPAPHADKLSNGALSAMLLTGPLSWIVQLVVGSALASWPCYPSTDPQAAPLPGYGWTGGAAMGLLVLAAMLSAAAALYAWRCLQEVRQETSGGHGALIEVGHGRTRFVALWGVILSASFAVATLFTLVGFAAVPRCAH